MITENVQVFDLARRQGAAPPCSRCGAHGWAGLVGGRLTCLHCGSPRSALGVPLLVVTGAAAAGKSTVCAGLAGTIPGLVALDVDVMAAGAAAVIAGREDYRAFWAYLLAVSVELAETSTPPQAAVVMTAGVEHPPIEGARRRGVLFP